MSPLRRSEATVLADSAFEQTQSCRTDRNDPPALRPHSIERGRSLSRHGAKFRVHPVARSIIRLNRQERAGTNVQRNSCRPMPRSPSRCTSLSVKCRPPSAQPRSLPHAQKGSGSQSGLSRLAPVARRYMVVTAYHRVRRSPGPKSGRERQMTALSPLLHPFPKLQRRVGPGSRLFLLSQTARHRPRQASWPALRKPAIANRPGVGERRLDRRFAIAPTDAAAGQARRNDAAIIDDEAVAGPQQVRQIRNRSILQFRNALWLDDQEPRLSRGVAGRSAIRSAGNSKSKRSVFMTSCVMPGLGPGMQGLLSKSCA